MRAKTLKGVISWNQSNRDPMEWPFNGLTLKQEMYCHAYVTCSSIEEACRVSGFASAPKSAKIAARIQNMRSKIQKGMITMEEHMNKLADLRDAAASEGKYGAAITAEVYRGRAAGFYDRKAEVINNDRDATDLSLEEIDAQLARIGDSTGSSDREENEALGESQSRGLLPVYPRDGSGGSSQTDLSGTGEDSFWE